MSTMRFIQAFAEMLLSPAALLYLLAWPKAIQFHRATRPALGYPRMHAA